MMRGKKLFAEVVGSNLFRVVGRDGRLISGSQERNAVAADLLQRRDITQPDDFGELQRIITQRIDEG